MIRSFPQILKLAGFNNQDDLIKYLGLKIPSKLFQINIKTYLIKLM